MFMFETFPQAWLEKYGYADTATLATPSLGAFHIIEDNDLSEAVRRLQRFVGLPETGMLKL